MTISEYRIYKFYHNQQIVSIQTIIIPSWLLDQWKKEPYSKMDNKEAYYNTLCYNHLMLLSKSYEGCIHASHL